MRIQNICLREIHLPLLSPFETSFGTVSRRRILLLEATLDGMSGWGECVAADDPFFSYETIETAWSILPRYVWPLVKGREFRAAAEIWDALGHIRGHNMARAALESAVWDAEAKLKGVPLWKLLGGIQTEIIGGASLGIQPSIDALIAKVEKELQAGYQKIKIKIKPGWDVEPLAALRNRFPRARLMADANCAYTMDDLPLLKQLDRFFLIMLEQPLAWDDLYGHAKLQRELQTPICLDECITSESDARCAIELGACKIINIKLGRVGGYTPAQQIHDLCREKGIPVWCGGMLETGIGRAHNVALSTLPNFVLPGDVSASRRYWTEDIIQPEVEVTPRGSIVAPLAPGIGFAPRVDRIESLTRRKEVLS